MIRCFIIACCFLLVQDEPVIAWHETKKITWEDFKDTPNNNTRASAITASGISFGFSIKLQNNKVVDFSTEVHAHFYPNKSWVKSTDANHHILGHEQLHFDITELYARKFRYEISKLSVSNNIKERLNALQNNINSELKKMQNTYDAETNYSRNFEAQEKWKTFIALELKKYNTYKNN